MLSLPSSTGKPAMRRVMCVCVYLGYHSFLASASTPRHRGTSSVLAVCNHHYTQAHYTIDTDVCTLLHPDLSTRYTHVDKQRASALPSTALALLDTSSCMLSLS